MSTRVEFKLTIIIRHLNKFDCFTCEFDELIKLRVVWWVDKYLKIYILYKKIQRNIQSKLTCVTKNIQIVNNASRTVYNLYISIVLHSTILTNMKIVSYKYFTF